MKHAIMRLIFDGEVVRDSIDIYYVSRNRYQLLPKNGAQNGPIMTKKTLKKYIIERMNQGEEDDYEIPFDAFKISIGKLPKNPSPSDWDLEGEISCELMNIDITDERDLNKICVRMDIWLDIFEESYV
jgi:hypothetical protein